MTPSEDCVRQGRFEPLVLDHRNQEAYRIVECPHQLHPIHLDSILPQGAGHEPDPAEAERQARLQFRNVVPTTEESPDQATKRASALQLSCALTS